MNKLIIYLLKVELKFNRYESKIFATDIQTIWKFTDNYLFTNNHKKNEPTIVGPF